MKNTLILIIALASCTSSTSEHHGKVNLDSLNSQAANFMHPHKFDSAEIVLNRILDLDPSNEDAINTLIQLYMFREDYASAFKYADSISRVHPHDYFINILMGVATEKLSGVDSAIYFYKQALDLWDTDTTNVKHKATLVTIVNRKPLTESQLDSIGETDQKIRNEITTYEQGGWLEIEGLGYSDPDPDFVGDLCYRLDTIKDWSKLEGYINKNGINLITLKREDDWFRLCVKKKFEQRAIKLGLTSVDIPSNIY